jgi:hypothetical protein
MVVPRKRLEVSPALDVTVAMGPHVPTGLTLGPSLERWVVAGLPGRTRLLRHGGGVPVTVDVAVGVAEGTLGQAVGREALVLVEPGGAAHLLDESGRITTQWHTGSAVRELQAAGGGSWFTLHGDGVVRQWDWQGQQLEQLALGWSTLQVEDARSVWGTTHDGRLQRWETGRVKEEHALRLSGVTAVALEDGRVVVATQQAKGLVLHVGALGHTRFQAFAALDVSTPPDGNATARRNVLAWRVGSGVCHVTVADLLALTP